MRSEPPQEVAANAPMANGLDYPPNGPPHSKTAQTQFRKHDINNVHLRREWPALEPICSGHSSGKSDAVVGPQTFAQLLRRYVGCGVTVTGDEVVGEFS